MAGGFISRLGRFLKTRLTILRSFLAGKNGSKAFDGIYVELFVGGDPLLAGDVDGKRDGSTGVAFPLEAVVGATQVATSEKLNPFVDFPLTTSGTQEMTVQLSVGQAGAGYAEGDPLWLIFSKDSVSSRSQIDNIAIEETTSAPVLTNFSFEDPVTATNVDGVTDWYDSVGYTWIWAGGYDGLALTPYGSNWANMGNGRWIYQQIGTFTENTDYHITFFAGQDSSKAFDGITVELLAGGDPNLAADANVNRLGGSFPLETVVGAVSIANSGKLNPFGSLGQVTQEMSVFLSTGSAGAGYAEGDPLWLLFYRDSITGRSQIDNIIIEFALIDPVAENPTPGVHSEGVDPLATMLWDLRNTVSPSFDVNIGTDAACDDILSAHVTGATHSYIPPAGLLDYGAEYFWRVDTLGALSNLMATGDVWDVSVLGIEAFVVEDDDPELFVNWTAGAGTAISLNDLYGAMQIDYDTQSLPYKAEATLSFSTA